MNMSNHVNIFVADGRSVRQRWREWSGPAVPIAHQWPCPEVTYRSPHNTNTLYTNTKSLKTGNYIISFVRKWVCTCCNKGTQVPSSNQYNEAKSTMRTPLNTVSWLHPFGPLRHRRHFLIHVSTTWDVVCYFEDLHKVAKCSHLGATQLTHTNFLVWKGQWVNDWFERTAVRLTSVNNRYRHEDTSSTSDSTWEICRKNPHLRISTCGSWWTYKNLSVSARGHISKLSSRVTLR